MSNPVIELIALNVLATVQGVTVANGYNYTLTAARRMKVGNPRVHLGAVIIQEDQKEQQLEVYNTKEWILPFAIGVYIIPTEHDITPIDTYCNLIGADVAKALMVDRTRGSNAINTDVSDPVTHVDELKDIVFVININVQYRTNELNPYQNAV